MDRKIVSREICIDVWNSKIKRKCRTLHWKKVDFRVSCYRRERTSNRQERSALAYEVSVVIAADHVVLRITETK